MNTPAGSLVDLSREWDVAIVGTGMGGSTLGQALAQTRLSVLFLEKGIAVSPPIKQFDAVMPADRMNQGWWPHPVTQRFADGRRERFLPRSGAV